MPQRDAKPVPAAEVRERFDHYQDEARKGPVLIAKDGRTETVLLSYEAFTHLERRARRAYGLDDLPDDLAAAILAIEVPDEHGPAPRA